MRNADSQAAILDPDGVVTRTATVHAGAWKEMFADFLASPRGDPSAGDGADGRDAARLAAGAAQ